MTKPTETGRKHGVDSVVWTNLGDGWIIQCLCGWGSKPRRLMEDAGAAFDEHLEKYWYEVTV